MKPEHYPNLELCRELTKIGFPDGTSCHFRKNNSDTYEHTFGPWDDESYVCPSVMEMLDVIPRDIHVGYHQYTWNITPYGFTYVPNQSHSTDKIPFFATDMSDDSDGISIDPNALAKMILWLHENNYITFK